MFYLEIEKDNESMDGIRIAAQAIRSHSDNETSSTHVSSDIRCWMTRSGRALLRRGSRFRDARSTDFAEDDGDDRVDCNPA